MSINFVSSHWLEYATIEIEGKFLGCLVKSTQGFYKKIEKIKCIFSIFPSNNCCMKKCIALRM